MSFESDVAFAASGRERIARRCVCCGSQDLAISPAILMPFIAHRAFGWSPVFIDDSWGLKTIENGHAYSICKSLRCSKCDHLFCDIRFSEEEMSAIYAGYREDAYVSLRDHYEPGYRERNDALIEVVSYKGEVEQFLASHVSDPLTVLDWGGDTGANTPFEHRRVSLDIFDISGKDVTGDAKTVSQQQATSSKYRLIVCSQILEHIPYPSDLLLVIREAMDGDSILYIEVPYEDVMRREVEEREKEKRHWHEHVNFYSPTSMAALLENCGLKVVDRNILVTEVAGSTVHILQVACRLA